MSNLDLRGLLQYVPQFRGRCFVVELRPALVEEDAAWRDLCLDLALLQGLGVRLILLVPPADSRLVHEQLVRVDLKLSLSEADQVGRVLERGQAALLVADELERETLLTGLASQLKLDKVIIAGAESLETTGARPAEAAREAGDRMSALGARLCLAGVRRVHFVDGRMNSALLAELFSNEGVGYMVYSDAYQEILSLSEEDIPELLSLIGRSVFDAMLLDRSYEDVQSRLGDYYVLKVDGNVVGSVALHAYPEAALAEIACLRIKESHEGLGYGRLLVAHVEGIAREAGLRGTFALSQSAGGFFRTRVSYDEWPREGLPASRLEALKASGRQSMVYGKRF